MVRDRLENISIPTFAPQIWSDVNKSRQFLIPETEQLPPGDFLLRTAAGREMRVDPAAVAKFEITAEEANAWLKDQLGDVLKNLRSGLAARFSGKATHGDRKDDSAPQKTKDADKSGATHGLDLLAEMTGTSRANLDSDYAALGRAFRAYLTDTAGTALDAVSGEPERMARAQERMGQWAEVLRQHGISVPQAPAIQTAAVPDASAPPQAGESIAGTMKKSTVSARLADLAEEFRHRADVLAAARKTTSGDRKPSEGNGAGPNGAALQSDGPRLGAGDGEQAAEALAALAQGLETAVGDLAGRLRELAGGLATPQEPQPEAEGDEQDPSRKT
jgi:hypothetical protein